MSGEQEPKRFTENDIEYIAIPVKEYEKFVQSYDDIHQAMTEMIIERDLKADQHTCKGCELTYAEDLESEKRICNRCMFLLMAEYIGYRQPRLSVEEQGPLVQKILNLMIGVSE